MIFKILEAEMQRVNIALRIEKPKTTKELENFINKHMGKPYINIKPRSLEIIIGHDSYCRRQKKNFEGICDCCNKHFMESVEYEIVIEFDIASKTTSKNNKENIAINNIRIYFIPDESTFQSTIDDEEYEHEDEL